MTISTEKTAVSRFYKIGFSALVLLIVTVVLGLYLGSQTRKQFAEIENSVTEYDGDVGQKGLWISTIRGYLGYGGIIHNFKNYILRRDQAYFDSATAQIDQFNAVVAQYLDETTDPVERDALLAIRAAIDGYGAKLPVAHRAIANGMAIADVDRLVAIDDTDAIQALVELELAWTRARAISTSRAFEAVDEGQFLIFIGFTSLALLMLAAMTIGTLLVMMLRDMRATMVRLSDELVHRRKLEVSEGRLASAVAQSPATIVITDTNARILYANQRFVDLTGWTTKEIEGQTPKFLQSGDTPPETYQDIRANLAEGREWHGIFRNKTKDGGSYWAETTILPLISPDGTIENYIGIGEDITEKRQAREQVARAQKLEAVGLLAGGIAHDFNNVLTTIVGAAHLAALDAPEGSDIAGEIEQIDIAAQRAQSLVQGLLTFARREPGKPRPNDLCVIVHEVTRLLRASVPPTIQMGCDEVPGQFMVLADHTNLHQVVMNLCRNAVEAIGSDDGNIEITITSLGDTTPEGLSERPDGWVRLDIRDDGPGMSEQTRAQLFDPFFTTKPLGKGSGLGLVVVAGLIEEMGGAISVDSGEGDGATFTVYLPGTSQTEDTLEVSNSQTPRGTERLILVDDQPEIAATFRRVLLRLGYRVEAYTSSITALEKFRAHPGNYDLLVTDMVMPDLNGEALSNHMRALCPDLPIVICTGYSPSGIAVTGHPPQVLNKPVDPAELARCIRKALDMAKAG